MPWQSSLDAHMVNDGHTGAIWGHWTTLWSSRDRTDILTAAMPLAQQEKDAYQFYRHLAGGRMALDFCQIYGGDWWCGKVMVQQQEKRLAMAI